MRITHKNYYFFSFWLLQSKYRHPMGIVLHAILPKLFYIQTPVAISTNQLTCRNYGIQSLTPTPTNTNVINVEKEY